jgi:hypothetical protein
VPGSTPLLNGKGLRWAMVGVVLSRAGHGFVWAFTRPFGLKQKSAEALRALEVEFAGPAKDSATIGLDWMGHG